MSEAEAAVPPAPGGNKKLLMVVLIFNVLIAGGLGYLVVSGGSNHAAPKEGGGEHGEKKSEEPHEFGPIVEIGSIVANLSGPEPGHYLKVTIHVEAANEEIAKELEHALIPIRSEALKCISELDMKDPDKNKAMHQLNDILTKRVVEMLGKEKVKRVYISEFVVQ